MAPIEDVLPGLDNVYEDAAGSMRLAVIGGMTAALVRIEIANSDAKPHRFLLRCDSGSWGENPAWLDPARYVGDNLTCGWNERADRLLVLGVGRTRIRSKPTAAPPAPRTWSWSGT